MRIALDAMGGDAAPAATVAGALAAAEDGFPILLTGDEAVLAEEIEARGGVPPNLTVHHASEQVEMDDAPRSALRDKTDSSLRVAFELVARGAADAVVTMGNSGAALAMGMFVGERMPGVLRPAIAALVPGPESPLVLLDVGATVDCRPEHLEQFGRMGAALASAAFDVARPRVGVLANGEEDGKGTELTRSACARLRASGLDFIGHVEPRQFLDGIADVVVTDGWTGNILLKTAEGLVSTTARLLRDAADSGPRARLGALLLRPALRKAFAHLDPATLGGGLLLGVQAPVVIGHGRSDGKAVAAALRFAHRLAIARLNERIAAALANREAPDGH